jgi:hypothetical protein
MFSSQNLRRVLAAVLACAAPGLLGALGPRDNFESRLLAAHNRERAVVGAPSLHWDSQLADGARKWAKYLAAESRFEHSPDEPGVELKGENLWAGSVDRFQPETMVGLWVAEKSDYRPGVFPNNSRSGSVESVSHYTQLIWTRTNKVGCALARGQKEDFLVCRYSQPGNVIGQRPA